MAFKTTIELEKEFEVSWKQEKVFELLSNVPKSVAHFPKVDELVDLGDNSYRWEMEKIGIQAYHIQTIYACTYHADKENMKVTWEPVDGVGNGVVSGSWELEETEKGTLVRFYTKGTLEIDLPFFVKMVVSPVVSMEFESMVDTYHENLQETMNQ